MTERQWTSRDIVRGCIEFRNPPRIAMSFNTMPVEGRVWDFTDFALFFIDPDPAMPAGEGEYGIVRHSFDPTGQDMGQMLAHPLADGWDRWADYQVANPADPRRYVRLRQQTAEAHEQGKYVYSSVSPLMQIPMDLRGMENWMMDLADHDPRAEQLLDRMVESNLTMIDHYSKAGVDGVITWDDLGTNERPFLSPELFREMYYPRYVRMIQALHERNMHFIHHCCGQVRQYMPMFIEGGWDVLQLDQPNLMGIDWLAEHAGGKICFWSEVDIQTTQPTGNLEAVEREAEHLVKALGRFGGGFMVKAYAQPTSVGITAAVVETQYRAFIRYGGGEGMEAMLGTAVSTPCR
ncbi:MAG: hypothetical protein IT440_01330 [Phycisphaeraceae bacterium]|nr:hypothetical protein [Phycisphaeraceae bacterium]